MKSARRFVWICGLLASVGLLLSIVQAQTVPLTPVDLSCEYDAAPLDIEAAAPRLSWKLAVGSPQARGVRQSAYQVMVASSPERLAEDTADVWDSGRIASDLSVNIAYAG